MADQPVDSGDKDVTCDEIEAHNIRSATTILSLYIVVVVLCAIAVVTDSLSIVVWREKAVTASGFYMTVLNAFKLGYAVFLLTATVLRHHRETVPPLLLTIVRGISGYAFFGTTFVCLLMVLDRNQAIAQLRTNDPDRLHRAKIAAAITAASLAPFSIGYIVIRSIQGWRERSTLAYGKFLTIAFRMLPWVVIMVCNLLLLRTLRAVQRRANHKFLNQFGTGITATVIISTFVSFLSYPAAQAYRLYTLFSQGNCIDNVAYHVIFILQIVDHPLNFLLYLALIKKFRRDLWRHLRWGLFAAHVEAESTTMFPTGLTFTQGSLTDTTKAAGHNRRRGSESLDNPGNRVFEAPLAGERKPLRVLTSLQDLQAEAPESAGQNN